MINKKIISFILLITIFASFVLAITYTGGTPTSGGTITNVTTLINFSINSSDSNMTGGALFINSSNVGALDCSLNSSCFVEINLTNYTQGYYEFYFLTSPTFVSSSTFNFTINTPPTIISNFSVTAHNTSGLNLSWSSSSNDTDIQGFNLYSFNNSSVTNNATYIISNFTVLNDTNYTHLGLTAGSTYYYLIEAVDWLNQTSIVSSMINKTVADSTPPVTPVITPTSGTTLNTTTPTIIIDYTAGLENVTLNILSGGTVIKTFSSVSDNFTWTPTLNNGTTYSFIMNATDVYGNEQLTNYSIITSNQASFNFSIVDTIHLTTPAPSMLISTALPGGYILLNQTTSMYTSTGNGFVRVRIDDITSPALIDIPNDIQPYSFCEEDYNVTSQDVIGSPVKNVYYLQNTYNETIGNALNCTDTDATGSIAYNIITKIPIPLSAGSGNYGVNIYYGMYDTN